MLSNEDVRPLAPEDAAECARLMSSTEPWLTFGRTFETCLAILTEPGREVYTVRDEDGIAGFIILNMQHGALITGYIQTLCIRSSCRGQGMGSLLIEWAEDRIFKESPNVFMCVSSFNTGARRLYERLGYEVIGSLRDYVIHGHDEILLRKTRGSWKEFRERCG